MVYEAVAAQPFNTVVFLGGMAVAGIPGASQALGLWLSARTGALPSDSPVPASSGESST